MKERKQEKEKERKKERRKRERKKERKIPANCRVDQLLVLYKGIALEFKTLPFPRMQPPPIFVKIAF